MSHRDRVALPNRAGREDVVAVRTTRHVDRVVEGLGAAIADPSNGSCFCSTNRTNGARPHLGRVRPWRARHTRKERGLGCGSTIRGVDRGAGFAHNKPEQFGQRRIPGTTGSVDGSIGRFSVGRRERITTSEMTLVCPTTCKSYNADQRALPS